jgi:hypothetical protein
MDFDRYLSATPGEIERRLRRVDLAWQFERALTHNAAPIALVGAVLGALIDRRFLALPALMGAWLVAKRLRPDWTLAEEREALRLLYSARAAGL